VSWTLVTGGTGTIGSGLVRTLLSAGKWVRVLSRDESKQVEFAEQLEVEGFGIDQYRMFVGDVRDPDRLERAMAGVETVYHAAALKHVTSCEYNPSESVLTNIQGLQNVVTCAIRAGVKQVVSMSSDKAAEPNNLMGATKLVGEKLLVQANSHAGGCRLMAVRFGNVVGSRGSVIPRWRESLRQKKRIRVTDPEATRFIMPPGEAAGLCIWAAENCVGGEVVIRQMPVMRVKDLAELVIDEYLRESPMLKRGDLSVEEVGLRPGETAHEKLVTGEEAARTRVSKDHLVILPAMMFTEIDYNTRYGKSHKLGREYSSDKCNPLTKEELGKMLKTWKVL